MSGCKRFQVTVTLIVKAAFPDDISYFGPVDLITEDAFSEQCDHFYYMSR